jgi:SM-20-related protein
MLAGNTFGQDGDIHTDWPNLEESLTGVLYLNRNWNDNWGGETIVYDKTNTDYCEISKFKAGKLIVFDGANPHIGKGPQRACGELRSIIAVQAVKTDAWNKLLDSQKQK